MAESRRPALRGYQQTILRGLIGGLARAPGETFTVMLPRQSGKNEVSAALVAWILAANAARGGTVVVCAPTLYPQASISLDRTAQALARMGLHRTRETGRRDNVLAVGDARAIFLSASPHAHVAGHTASLALIADEAQDIDADWFNRQFRPMAASTGAGTVLFGTPWNGESLLEVAVRRNRQREAAPRCPLHHEVSWQRVAESVPAYGRYVRQERERLGAGHPLFVTQYALQTTREAGRLLTPDHVARLAGAHEALSSPVRGERYVMGLDFGGDGSGADATVLAVARVGSHATELVHLHVSRGEPYETVVETLEHALRRWRPARVAADATGLGGPLVEALAARTTVAIDRVSFTPAVKSELGFGLIAAANTGRLRLYAGHGPEIEECREQLRACTARRVAGGLLRWGNERGNDDIPVALGLCLRAAAAAGGPRRAAGRAR